MRYKGWAITILFLRCASMSTHITWPLFTKFITDALVVYEQTHHIDWTNILWIMVLGFVGWFGTDLPDIAARIISGPIVPRIRADVRTLVMEDLYHQSQQFYHDNFSASISSSLRDLSEAVSDIAFEIIFQFIPAFLIVITLSAIFCKMNVGYIILMAVWTVIQVAVIYKTRRKSQDKSATFANYRSSLYSKIIDSLSNHLTVRNFGATKQEQEHIIHAEEELIRARINVVNYTQKAELFTAFIEAAFVFFGFMAIYMWLFQQGKATAGDLMFLIGGIWGLMKTVNDISERMLWLYEQVGIAQQAIRKILVPHSVTDKLNANMLEVTSPTIRVENLGFGYYKEKPILRNVNLTIGSGEKIGLVGYSGAGKTTFVHLLMRFYDATEGRILIHGQDITEVTQESLRQNIALIPQDITLFHRSLRENIRIAKPDANDAQIIQACELAGAHDFIMTLPLQYETMVGERGIKLSGGQRQRIAIARVLERIADPDSGRGNLGTRFHDRTKYPGRAGQSHVGPHDDGHCAPPFDLTKYGPHFGVRSGADRRRRIA